MPTFLITAPKTQCVLQRLIIEVDRHWAADIGSQEQVKTLLDSHFLQEIANLGILDIQIFNDNGIRNRKRSKCLGGHRCVQCKQQCKNKLVLAYKIHGDKFRKIK
jgi:hypothetical protein